MKEVLFNFIIRDSKDRTIKRRVYVLCLCIESHINTHKKEITYDCYFLKGEGNLKKGTSFLIPSVLILGSKRRLTSKEKHLIGRLKNVVSGFHIGYLETADIYINSREPIKPLKSLYV